MVASAKLGDTTGLVAYDKISPRWILDGLAAGVTVSKGYLMVKATYATADGAASISKTITTSNSAGTGQIEDDGTTDQSAVLRFDLTATDTGSSVTAGATYYYAVKAILSDGTAVTIEEGTATWQNGVVQAST